VKNIIKDTKVEIDEYEEDIEETGDTGEFGFGGDWWKN